jgi:hypothetical protein
MIDMQIWNQRMNGKKRRGAKGKRNVFFFLYGKRVGAEFKPLVFFPGWWAFGDTCLLAIRAYAQKPKSNSVKSTDPPACVTAINMEKLSWAFCWVRQ